MNVFYKNCLIIIIIIYLIFVIYANNLKKRERKRIYENFGFLGDLWDGIKSFGNAVANVATAAYQGATDLVTPCPGASPQAIPVIDQTNNNPVVALAVSNDTNPSQTADPNVLTLYQGTPITYKTLVPTTNTNLTVPDLMTAYTQINSAVNDMSNDDALQVATGSYVDGALFSNETEIIPVGYIIAYAGQESKIPYGWHLCDGSTIESSKTKLISIIGNNYPNLNARVAIGYSSNYPINSFGGEYDNLLSINQLPTHTHTTSLDGAHAHTLNTTNSMSSKKVDGTGQSPNNNTIDMYTSDETHTHEVGIALGTSTRSQGVCNKHNNLQPYMCLHYIIRTI